MKPSLACYEIIKQFEGLRLNAYLDSVGIPTIGYGSTFYEDGTKVKMGDRITKERADSLFKLVVDTFAKNIDNRITAVLNQNQYDSLVSFTYNVGVGAFGKSTLLKKVNANPCDPSIRDEFLRWNKGGGRVLHGLTARRRKEADLYFKVSRQ
jgi:lysozyme